MFVISTQKQREELIKNHKHKWN